jgi:hypothetical protein
VQSSNKIPPEASILAKRRKGVVSRSIRLVLVGVINQVPFAVFSPLRARNWKIGTASSRNRKKRVSLGYFAAAASPLGTIFLTAVESIMRAIPLTIMLTPTRVPKAQIELDGQ